MKLDIKELITLADKATGKQDHLLLEGVSKDTRQKSENALYLPIAGERFDGHDFLLDAIKQGCTATIWQEGKELPAELPEDFPVLYTTDTVEYLQKISKFYLKKINPVVVAVTGSNGKTTTKDMIECVSAANFKTYKTQGNYNNHIGMPLTILAMEESTEVLILEMGMSNYGEISLLSKIAEPDVAVITNIGESHLEQLGSREGIAKAKLEIAVGLKQGGLFIIDGDEPLLSHVKGENVLQVGFGDSSTLKLSNIKTDAKGVSFTLEEGTTVYRIPMLGRHNIKNAAYAIAVGHYLNIEENKILEGLESLKVTSMRLEMKSGKKETLLINDAYNASPTSMIAALETLSELKDYSIKVAVLGDMYELGSNEEEMHRNIANHVDETISHVICVGQKGAWIADELNKQKRKNLEVIQCLTKEEAIKPIEKLLSKDTAILFKASRGMVLETLISTFLEEEQESKK
ncbi:UDP-N-acetylmuramoylalanyl-D-glutamate--2,6-diaminopimelate ligase [Fictibacillus phosphorivorans]|uniref:UDP-N-acetylmuramoyl-tripeptide--D-alanyl-D-alanine ligase n=1 Tax=Fictibacillus phosphorivorans TaxID=1221500 RepID=A0A163QUP6_9BACL|nr:UDP-N-acetylmuramoyl-tripeptide--D-alanyl-D-alanine ligase [Fictibacillus phosphorivorans]KZE65781.1 UDP-N-acetylmuramoylalanyl-D-glutamate--2,6-diaminopimelate ligase [Fictibacillus phosphorivorans]